MVKLTDTPIERIDVDKLEVTLKDQPLLFKGRDELTGKYVEKKIPQEGLTICTQCDNLYIHYPIGWNRDHVKTWGELF
ncbi:MAG: hypothetical protein MK188_01830 [Gammaproteobacteria bacterium]|nr:hypothetical protein [Gammaproteobacteria bacterium]